jgi:hypothetical protein
MCFLRVSLIERWPITLRINDQDELGFKIWCTPLFDLTPRDSFKRLTCQSRFDERYNEETKI